MRNSCAKLVELSGVTGGKVRHFYTSQIVRSLGVEKQSGFTTLFTRLFHSLIHPDLLVFQSINYRFLPTIHTTNKYNNEYKLTYYYNWRMLV